jgi:hypothetical protein
MFQLWKEAGIVTYAGFIMGLPGDTPATVKRDVEIIQKELAVDVLEFTILTPLPGSEDHKVLYEKGVWMDPDLNKYDIENVTTAHSKMTTAEWQKTYRDVWDWYYTDEHVERMMKRNIAYGIKPVNIWRVVMQIYGAMAFEDVHPQQCGYFRLKDRKERRPELPRVPALVFYPQFAVETLVKYTRFLSYAWKIHRMRKRLAADPTWRRYSDLATTRVVDAETEHLEMFELNDSSRAVVEKARKQAEQRKLRERRQHAHEEEVQIEAAE